MKVLAQINLFKALAASVALGLGFNALALPALAERQLLAMGLVPHVSAPHAGKFSTLYARGRAHKGRSSWLNGRSHLGRHERAASSHGFTKLKRQAPVITRAVKQAVKSPVVARVAPVNFAAPASSSRILGPGAVYSVYGGRTRINLVDINMSVSPLEVRPITAASNFHGLKDVLDHSRDSGAIAAINANYFKPNGVPLGTLMLDGEWFSGPLYDRVALGFTDSGYARIGRVGLHGVLHTSNPEHPELWINNVNQPRRTGSHCILYTRRWGESVSLPYPGTLIAVSGSGEVIDRAEKQISIPYGGYVLADSRESSTAILERGDIVKVDWHITPGDWQNVSQAVSGGPLLLKDGKMAFDLASEKFASSWTGSQITRRTACGITADDHLLLATFEGPHTLYDVAKFFLKHGCTEAMNLDGGGSTTMVVKGTTVTRNASDSQRRVAVALGLFSADRAHNLAGCNGCGFSPRADLASLLPVSDPLRDMILGQDPLHDLYNDGLNLTEMASEVASGESQLAQRINSSSFNVPDEETTSAGQLGTAESAVTTSPFSQIKNSHFTLPKADRQADKSAKLKPVSNKGIFKGKLWF